MNGHLPTAVRVAGFRRAVEAAGGIVTVVARGDGDTGTVLLVLPGPAGSRIVERGPDGRATAAGPESPDDASADAYLARRRRNDPDLWILEAIVADPERFAAPALWAD